ncbi:uncharacterized protein LOC111283165 isoform X2 [Durio zibethinus]|uniref:Uncharacterized protein LOC111283165 isoform X2 n=1 Tax=Durio zibethinus TaxID=66656 RepID=A0A6P5XG79_DURZI|nr:uncharacterized protein LOC111283165 isoform X2 [Durio zibethinus]
MRGKGVMRGFSRPKSCSRKKTLKRCNMKGKFENVVLIDVDGDGCENVIIIDAFESVGEDLQGSSGSKGGKRFPSPGVISIDDDETDTIDDPEICVECGPSDSDASSSKSCPAPDFMRKSAGLYDDECQFVREKKSAFKLSKCKKTYTGKTPCRKCFGLSPESEDSSSESDCSDCELMEGCFGKLREQWEKAFQQKKYSVRNGQSGLEDQTSASGSRNDTPPGVEQENRTQKHSETPSSSGSSGSNIQKQRSYAFETNSAYYSCRTCLNRGTENPFVESDKKVEHESFSQSKYGPTAEAQFSHVLADVIFERETFMKNPPSGDGDRVFAQAPSNRDPYPSDLQHGKKGSNGKEKLQSKEPLMSMPKLSEEKQVDDGMTPSVVEVETVFDQSSSVKTPLGGMPVVSNKNHCDREKVVSENSSECDETQITQSYTEAEKSSINSVANSKKYDGRNKLHVQGVDAAASGENDIIIDREKLKETDEYKRAAEEEWASRQRELQILAEEAQRLRKRKRAESIRLLDMERRQKQRLEEMRETQKKVNAAYKRALLGFHPDRASRTDICQQVEAEEKFKLISCMKEKFL